MLRSNTNKFRNKVQKHILNHVWDETGDSFESLEECIKYMKERFEAEYNYTSNQKRFPNKQNRFHEYMQGLPFGFEFYTDEIIEILAEWKECNEDRLDRDEANKMYHYYIYKEVFK